MLTQLGSHYGRYWVVPVGATGLLLYRWLQPPTRSALWIVCAIILVTAIIGQIQMVRPPVSLFLLVSLCAILCGLIGHLPKQDERWGIQPLAAATVLIAAAGISHATRALDTPETTPHNNLLRELSSIQSHIESYRVQTVLLQPEHYLPVMHLYQTSRPISKATGACDTPYQCYVYKGVRWTSYLDDRSNSHSSLIVSVEWVPKQRPARCTQLRSKPAYSLWLCPPVTTSKSGQLPTTEQ